LALFLPALHLFQARIKDQTLSFKDKTYSISSAANGLGEEEGSFCTPTGKFKIASMIGDGLEIGAVLAGRVPTWLHYNNIFTDFNAFKQLNNILVTQSNTTF
jgi:hypothetical protein